MVKNYTLNFGIKAVRDEIELEEFKSKVLQLSGVTEIDIDRSAGFVRVISDRPISFEEIRQIAVGQEHHAPESTIDTTHRNLTDDKLNAGKHTFKVKGMHCRSCEITIEREFMKIDGVHQVDVSLSTGLATIKTDQTLPSIKRLQEAVAPHGYSIEPHTIMSSEGRARHKDSIKNTPTEKTNTWSLIGTFIIVIFLGKILMRFGLFLPNVSISESTSLVAIFFMGLIAASSSCVAVSGGLLLASVNTYRQRYGESARPIMPVLIFVLGRIISYGVLGGFIGFIGKSMALPPLAVGGITILAASYMFIMGLDMLHIAPTFIKRILPRMPKRLAHKLMDQQESSHPAAPFLLGAATFFLPCGFTQALQLYALTTGSVIQSAALLGVFALGTAPSLILLGWAANSLKGMAGKFFYQLAGAAVIVLGFWNFQNGLTIAGYPLSWPSVNFSLNTNGNEATAAAPGVVADYDGNAQTINMGMNLAGYDPNEFVLRKGVPTRWIIDGSNARGCISVIQIPKLRLQRRLTSGQNIIEFNPTETGALSFSCGMGMYRGVFNVVDNI